MRQKVRKPAGQEASRMRFLRNEPTEEALA
jgi:hypothetical protein